MPVGSLGGSISLGATFALNMYPYNTSKTALNWLFRKLHTDYTDMSESHAMNDVEFAKLPLP